MDTNAKGPELSHAIRDQDTGQHLAGVAEHCLMDIHKGLVFLGNASWIDIKDWALPHGYT